jgi:hypothetical protein
MRDFTYVYILQSEIDWNRFIQGAQMILKRDYSVTTVETFLIPRNGSLGGSKHTLRFWIDLVFEHLRNI